VEAAQIKEKFGTLRIYLRTGGNDFMSGAIQFAELMSGTVCERTGQPGKMCRSREGWRKTLSPEKAKEFGYFPIEEAT
jgi:hypothetical protein